jgi:SAM-dependent methyltransferase
MSFTLSQVVPWGRDFEEYRGMFALSDEDLATRILGCGDGPASFNAEATKMGYQVVSVDPIYQFSGPEIDSWIKQVAPTIAEQTRRNSEEFSWSHFRSVDDLVAARMSAMSRFLVDYSQEDSDARYVAASLPELPFPDKAFDLALCSHFLFLYSEQFDATFHVRSMIELARTASEVRIFPLLELGSRPSRHLDAVVDAIRSEGLVVARVRVPYEFQKGGNEMLRISG